MVDWFKGKSTVNNRNQFPRPVTVPSAALHRPPSTSLHESGASRGVPKGCRHQKNNNNNDDRDQGKKLKEGRREEGRKEGTKECFLNPSLLASKYTTVHVLIYDHVVCMCVYVCR